MIVIVKLYGMLSRKVAGYEPDRGLEISVSEGATVGEVIGGIGIGSEESVVVVIDGEVAGAETPVCSGSVLRVFQPLHGG
ncbi:ThiS family protein [Desulfacinum infernum DSM 9756]|uniref:ThiS family protein n=1 Tax=Desulfacinum infernum DSM 9756 TaxID=1121391 RepID=A0A1M5G6P5_9BACT|nr:MoaD/ThiS family protein [Desulfacinum infernum]SHF99425.1 ThiS family protein [Desulfacinum infernum DSM 9756]